ncbi:MAG: hypothetical protein ISR46_03495 [Rhodospirillales bacterium]|nr:hypothetical protein [Rhodospirillales bacterium]
MRQLLMTLILMLGMCFQPGNLLAGQSHVSLPKIENNFVAPRVIYIENPRFPNISNEELWKIIQLASDLIKEHFEITVIRPKEIPVFHIDNIFTSLVENKPPEFDDLIGDFRNGKVDWGYVKESLIDQIGKQRDPLIKQIEFARPYLVQPLKNDDLESFANAIIETFRTRLSYWTSARLEDGYPVIGEFPGRQNLPLNEYGYWTLMAKRGVEADIILTNQLVASVEYMPIPIHTSIRGGITGGSTEYIPASQFGSSVWVSLFPYLSNDKQIKKLRNGDVYTRDKALTYASAMLAHELGHQLLQLGHPWSNEACIMRPAEVLDFASWVKKIDAKKCQIGSSPAMNPGALEIPVW